jgi:hypothetical protein
LKKIRAKYPCILFQGETVGGDVGAKLYAHFNAKGGIDGLIIDNNYFFSQLDESSCDE